MLVIKTWRVLIGGNIANLFRDIVVRVTIEQSQEHDLASVICSNETSRYEIHW